MEEEKRKKGEEKEEKKEGRRGGRKVEGEKRRWRGRSSRPKHMFVTVTLSH